MELEWPPLPTNSLHQDSCFATDTQYGQQESWPSQNKPPIPKNNAVRQQLKPYREKDRSVSQRRRHYSTSSSSRQRRREKQIVIKQQPGGWYQVDRIGRNLSLAPRSSSKSGGSDYYYYSGDQAQKKRKNKRNRRRAVKCPNQSRFPSPSIFDSNLGILQELPCARLHYDSFRRLFPALPTRTEKERKFRLEAAKEFPFAKYPDDQLYGILDISDTKSSLKPMDELQNTKEVRVTQLVSKKPSEGDTQVSNEANGESDNEDLDELNDVEACSENGRVEDVIVHETVQNYPENTHVVQDSGNQSPIIQRPSTTLSEDFLSLSDAENKIYTGYLQPGDKDKLDTVPYVDSDESAGRVANLQSGTHTDIENVDDNKLQFPCNPDTGTNFSEWVSDRDKISNSPHFLRVTSPNDTISGITTFETTDMSVIPESRGGTVSMSDDRVHKPLTKAPRARQSLRGVPCSSCGQIAYPAERLEADSQVFHFTCFRCQQCGTLLQRGGWNQRGAKHFCNPCHRRIALQTLRH